MFDVSLTQSSTWNVNARGCLVIVKRIIILLGVKSTFSRVNSGKVVLVHSLTSAAPAIVDSPVRPPEVKLSPRYGSSPAHTISFVETNGGVCNDSCANNLMP
jgi:hypothetical protein